MDEEEQADRRREVRPGTYGELRRQLEENGNPWTVDPLTSDDEPLPEFPLGGLSDEEDAVVAAARLGEHVDIRELIAEFPPNDPGLRKRWQEADMPLDRVPDSATGDGPDTAGDIPDSGDGAS